MIHSNLRFHLLTPFVVFLGTCSISFAATGALSLVEARRIADAALQCGAKNNWKLSVAIVNSEGNLALFLRGDDSYSGSIEAAIQKAKSANAFRRPTSAFVDAIKEGRTGLVTVKDIAAIEGGVPIQRNGTHLGAIGISGARSTEDAECAQLAVKSLIK